MLEATHKILFVQVYYTDLNKLLGDVKIGPFFKLIDFIQPLCSKLFQGPLISAINYTTSFTQRNIEATRIKYKSMSTHKTYTSLRS